MTKTMSQRVKATEIEAGMILKIYGGSERFDVEQAAPNGYGAVIIRNWFGEARGLGENETVEVIGHFNPDES